MREAYLINNSQSITSIPLFERVPVTVRGRTLQKVQYKSLVPNEELIVGRDITAEKKAYYQQFKSVLVELRFRNVVVPKEEISVEVQEVPEVAEPKVSYSEEALMKMRQAELIAIAEGLGLEVTTQNSKAEITKMILEKTVG